MRLRQLFEDTEKHVSFCFGRMNPPTIGHAEVFKTLAGIGGDYFIFLSQSQDKKENPLSYEEKVNFLKTIHPTYAGHIIEDRNLNTVVKVASYLYDQGYRHATFVAGSDRLDQFKNLLKQYNGVEGKAHGYYNFDLLDFKSSGDRDPDSPGVSGVSASKAREAAANNDFAKFQEATGAGNVAKQMFDAVRQGMGIKESIEEGWKSKMAGAALAAANLLASPAQAAEEPEKPITIAYVMIDGEVRKYNLGDKFANAKEAEKFISGVLDKQGLQGYTLDIKHGYPKKKEIKEAPIEMDPTDPMDPMIYGAGGNPAKLKYRMMRASIQLKDLAARAQEATPVSWELISKDFDELAMNISQIKHGLEELAKLRKKGGLRSRGIDRNIG